MSADFPSDAAANEPDPAANEPDPAADERDARVIDLEVRLSYQERLIESLNDVVSEFAGRVETLERHVRALEEAGDNAPIGPAQDKPPHY